MSRAAILSPMILAFRRLPGAVDVRLLALTATLLSVGMVMVFSASISYADHRYGSSLFFIQRHLIYLLMALAAGFLVLQIPVRSWYRYSDLVLLMAVFLLVAVLVPGVGREVNGARRWISLGVINLQVAELAKFAMIVFVAGYLHRHQLDMRGRWQALLKPMAMLGIVGLLLLLQPDFGSAVVIAGTVLALLFLAGVRLWVFLLILGAGVAGLGFLAISSEYRMQRLVAFLDPWADMYSSGYQLTQSLIAFGRGQWFGVGLGNSVQKLFYLPEAHTDFVFAIFAEEMGLFGVLIIVALFVFMVQRIFAIARSAVRRQDWFAAYAAFGVGVLIAGQAFINIGVTSGLLPTKGLTLPFISYGGSSLVVSCMMMALVLRIGVEMSDSAWAHRQQGQKPHG
ncbi:MAG: putative lipid II flippase FtsW [Porticoccaceae bacterium]|nr:putative lipid II flippase FtsW [Porticoccaceae bacterium]